MKSFAVLAEYPAPFRDLAWEPVTGGFSGARVYASATHILKAWPPGTDASEVQSQHRYWTMIDELDFVPRLVQAIDGRTAAEVNGTVWEIATRCSGECAKVLSPPQVQAAAAAMTRMHITWMKVRTLIHPVDRRVGYVNFLISELPNLRVDDDLRDLHRFALERLRPLMLQPHTPDSQIVHGDLHREHILFTGDRISGVVDFSSIKRDHPALDLARYFGEFDLIDAGVNAYLAAGGSSTVTASLVRDLVQVIAAGTITHWLPRLAADDYSPGQRDAIVGRIRGAIGRLN